VLIGVGSSPKAGAGRPCANEAFAAIGPQATKAQQAALRRGPLHAGATLGRRPARYSGRMPRLILAGLILLLAGCSRTTDEQRIRASMAAMEQAM